jgi:hypothetical protein
MEWVPTFLIVGLTVLTLGFVITAATSLVTSGVFVRYAERVRRWF